MTSDVENQLIFNVQHGRLDAVEIAMDDRISSNLIDADGCSLLHWAAINNRVQIAQLLLDRGALVNAVGGIMQEMPLQWCCRSSGYGYTHMLKLLVKAGADVNYNNSAGHSALHLCVQGGSLNLAFLLLEAGADVDCRDCDGLTPLMWILHHQKDGFEYNGQATLDLIRLLITYGADTSLTTHTHGDTVLHLLARQPKEIFDHAIAFNILKKSSDAPTLLAIRNQEDTSAEDLAVSLKSSLKGVLDDFKLYMITPIWLVTLNWAVLVWSFFACIHGLKWKGIFVWSIVLIIHLYTCQKSLVTLDYRPALGFAWGTITALTMNFFINTVPYITSKWSYIVGSIVFVICWSLYKTNTTPPASLPKMMPHSIGVAPLVERVAQHGVTDGLKVEANAFNGRNFDGGLDGEDDSAAYTDGTAADTSGSPPRICPTCLVDRSVASMHCSRCDMCCVGLDHHCPFVGICVGRGNRRMFTIFCGTASVGCCLVSLLSLWVQYNGFIESCLDVIFRKDLPITYLHVQICMINTEPAIAILCWFGFIVGLWIAALFWSQIDMVVTETTTFAMIENARILGGKTKKNIYGKVIFKGKTGTFKGCRRSIMNLVNFFRRGKYSITYDSAQRRQREGKNKYMSHNHDKTVQGEDNL